MAAEPKQPFTEKVREVATALGIERPQDLPGLDERPARAVWDGVLTDKHESNAKKLWKGFNRLAGEPGCGRQRNEKAIQLLGTESEFVRLAADQYELRQKGLEPSHRNLRAAPTHPASPFTVERILFAPFCPGVGPDTPKTHQGLRYKREEGDSLIFESSKESHIELRWFRWGGAVWTVRETNEFQSLAELARHRRRTYRDVREGRHLLRALTERINRAVSPKTSRAKLEQTHIGYVLSIYSVIKPGWPDHCVPNALQILASPNVLFHLPEISDCEDPSEGDAEAARMKEAKLLRDGVVMDDLHEILQPGHVRGYACWAGVAIHVEEGLRTRLLQSAISFQQELQALWWRLNSLSTCLTSGQSVPVAKELFQTLKLSVHRTLRIGPTEVTSLRLFKEAVIETSRFSPVFDQFLQIYRDTFPNL